MSPQPPPLILASTSPFRRELLARLGLPFEVAAPGGDEERRPGEGPQAMVARLAEQKARSVAAGRPGALVIGSDQCAVLQGEVLGKPGDHEKARRQLERASGREVDFLTGLCLLDTRSGRAAVDVVPFRVGFRDLDAGQIERYLQADRPYGCAGSFKAEGLGIALFRRMHGEDPTALIGLPLIRLVDMLAEAGVVLP